jgi:diguanylate cyclase (GGDEF)-like protein
LTLIFAGKFALPGVIWGVFVFHRRQRQIALFLLIALPVAIAAIAMLWTSSRMLNGISESVDRQEASRTWQAIQSAIGSAQERLAGTVTDNAHWDDAASHVYGPIDDKWMYDTWGVNTSDVNYDTIYVVDAAGKSLVSYHHQQPFKTSADRYFGKSLQLALSLLPADTSTFRAISTLVNTPDGLTVMAAAPVLPTSDGVGIPSPKPNVLIFGKALTADMLAKMGEQYIIDGLDIYPVEKVVMGANVLNDAWGNAVAVAAWKPRHPGEAASKSYRLSALITMLALIGVMTPLSLAYARAMAKMDEKEKSSRLAARRDALSGLPNRVSLLEELDAQLAAAKPAELALIFVDLDGFKAVNDVYDHETGDRLIKAVSAGLGCLVKGLGILARLGGDEFAIVVTGKNALERAEAIGRNVLAFVKEPFDINGRIASIGASVGVAELGPDRLEPAELMRRADIAMYDAKDSGRNRMRRFDDALDQKRSEDVMIANELRAFIHRGEFDVAYQPMVDSQTHSIIGVEALARWPKSSHRVLEPSRFISVAEEHGLIDGLGALILRIACRDIAQWSDLKLAVNISAVQINNPSLISDIKSAAGEYDLALDRLEVEFTESVLIKNPKRAKQVIQELQECGVTVALDDFGTGYASVGYLREYAFNKIKLDQSLTRAILFSTAAQQVVQGTILIAKGLSADIIAEGVETEQEAILMRLSGCNQLQGFYFGRPQAVAAVASLFSEPAEEPRASA